MYIGQSRHIERGWREHIKGNEESVISKAIQKYGKENFEFGVIEWCPKDKVFDREEYYIKKYGTFKKGYNMTTGGDGVKGYIKILTEDDVWEIIHDLKAGKSSEYIADKYCISVGYVSKLNLGESWYFEGVEYPIRKSRYDIIIKTIDKDELLKDVATLGFKGAGIKHDMTGNGIKSRCRSVGLPTNIKDIRRLYGVDENPIKAVHKGVELDVSTEKELVEYIILNELTSTDYYSVLSSVRRTIRGDRKSYLGITMEYKKGER